MVWMQAAGIGLSMLSSYMGDKQESDDIAAANAVKREQHKQNVGLVADMLGTLDSRTSRAESEAVRASIRTKMSVKKAQHRAEGEATVKAAHLGTGSGKRASLATFRPSARLAGDLITDANVNLQTELTGITEHFNDTARKAIINLNNSTPLLGTGPSTGEMLMGAAGAGLSYWNSMSDASKAEVKSLFKPGATPQDNTLVLGNTDTFTSRSTTGPDAALGPDLSNTFVFEPRVETVRLGGK